MTTVEKFKKIDKLMLGFVDACEDKGGVLKYYVPLAAGVSAGIVPKRINKVYMGECSCVAVTKGGNIVFADQCIQDSCADDENKELVVSPKDMKLLVKLAEKVSAILNTI